MQTKILASILLSLILFACNQANPKQSDFVEAKDCEIHEVEKTIRGNSMQPLLQPNQKVTLLENYYACNEVERGDIVAFQFPSQDYPMIKNIVALPNDLLEFEDKYLKVNGEILKNSEGNPYLLTSKNQAMLKLYLDDKGKLKPNRYFIFGDRVNFTYDSRKFGGITKERILGKFEF